METYNFWQDAFDTYQSQSDFVQTMWIALPCLTVFAVFAALMRYKLICKGHILHHTQRPRREPIRWYAQPPSESVTELQDFSEYARSLNPVDRTDNRFE